MADDTLSAPKWTTGQCDPLDNEAVAEVRAIMLDPLHTDRMIRLPHLLGPTVVALIARNRELEAERESEGAEALSAKCRNLAAIQERDIAEIAALKAERERLIAAGNAMAEFVRFKWTACTAARREDARLVVDAWKEAANG